MMKTFSNSRISNGKREIFCFILGGAVGAVWMLTGGVLYLRSNLLVRYDLPLSMYEVDSAFAQNIPGETGWSATPEVCAIPMASDGRKVSNWKLCHRMYARMLLDSARGSTVGALLPCTVSITEGEDGHAVVSRLNTSLIGMILGGDASSVFREKIAPEQDALIRMLGTEKHIKKDAEEVQEE